MLEPQFNEPQADERNLRETHFDLPDEGTLILPTTIPHEPERALAEIRLPPDANQLQAASATVLRCPRCQTPLSERCDIGWCQRCGYCRYMEKRRIVPASVVRAQHEALLHASRRPLMPPWLGVLCCGALVCSITATLAGLNLPAESRTRDAWYTAQAGVALTLMLMGHVTAFMRLVPHGERRRHAVLLVSPRLWWGVWRRLPATQSSVWLAGWGLTLALGAALLYAVLEAPRLL